MFHVDAAVAGTGRLSGELSERLRHVAVVGVVVVRPEPQPPHSLRGRSAERRR